MHYLGKLLGFIAGWMLGGPMGAIFGLLIGQYFDLSASGYWSAPHQKYQTTGESFSRAAAQRAFFESTFLVMGHIAKASGRVGEGEIQAARIIMRNMNLSSTLKREAIEFFTRGKEHRFNLEVTLDKLLQACQGQLDVLRMFVDIQFQAAAVEGFISPQKRDALEHICRELGLNSMDFFIFHQRHHRHYQEYTYNQKAGAGAGPQRPRYTSPILEDPYKILGVTSKATDAEVKKAYRKKISANHPDKLVAKGLPEEMIKLANKKTAEIKKAYDTIAKQRGIK
ncbi:MAG: co-chaperone DjlA [Gammaproteobacteria bacterium]|nr:co-chaperone DjlA [Gammaproteobacteria bacterium]